MTLRTAEGETVFLWTAEAPAPGSAVSFAVPPEHLLRFP